ncbi:MAG: flavin-containing monooxygenase [Solirubrobacteraceae bacterium]
MVVVGGGQAGLAIGFTAARYSGLPGLAFPGDPDSYPGRDEVAAYLTDYARRFALPVQLSSRVRSVRHSDGRYVVELEDRVYTAHQVVVATGPFQVPLVPPILAAGLATDVVQLHSSAYRSPADLADGPTVVVGGGNTGFQIAKELSVSRQTHLSIGSPQKPLRQRILGRDLFWYLDKTGLIRKSRETRMGRRLEGRDLLIGSSPRELRKRYGVQLHSRTTEATGRRVRFADGDAFEVASVVWATGFRHDHAWIEAPVFDDEGRVAHRRGVTAALGLYFLGLTWQHTRGSALIGFVAGDAAYIAREIKRNQSTAMGPRSGEPIGVA